MMKRITTTLAPTLALALALALLAPAGAMAADDLTQTLLRKIEQLEARVGQLERERTQAMEAAAKAQQAAEAARRDSASSLKMSQELAKTKEEQTQGLLSDAGKRVKVYGAVELEGAFERMEPEHGSSSDSSSFNVATAELFVEANINKFTMGLIHLLYEGEGDAFNVDEAFIVLGQTEDMPAYLMGGRIYPAIGLFETYLVSDPITLNVFETQAMAAEAGYAGQWFNFGVGGYNAGVHQADDGDDSTINTFYARLQVTAPEGALGEGVGLSVGAAYTNNIAGGNLGDEVAGETVQDLVGGWSAMASLSYKWLALTGEYITAVDDFNAGELNFADGDAKPYAYNIELALMPIDDWTFAVRYEGSGDLGDFEPERQWGAAVSWDLLPDTTLSLEYLRGDYANDDTRDLVTTQLAVAF